MSDDQKVGHGRFDPYPGKREEAGLDGITMQAEEISRLRNRLAQIERQVIYRTADMPEWATDWEKEDSFCRWTNYWDDNLADIAPDLRPGSALPIRLPIIDPPNGGG